MPSHCVGNQTLPINPDTDLEACLPSSPLCFNASRGGRGQDSAWCAGLALTFPINSWGGEGPGQCLGTGLAIKPFLSTPCTVLGGKESA